MRARRSAALGCLLAAVLLLTGCLSMPTSGPVVETQAEGGANRDPGFYINPRPPQPDDTRADIVRGFLVAMTATPIQTNTAKEFLTEDAAATWSPENETITYTDYPPLRETNTGVAVTLPDPHLLDARGAWQGPLPSPRRTIEFPMAFEDGEWRIDAAPDALIVPESWFEQRYRAASLYYFDPTASILVPEPVYVPRGRQLTSTLMQALLLGPSPDLKRVVQSFIPSGLKVSLSVPISDGGIADIALRGDGSQLTEQSIELMMVQFAWTLTQVPEISGLRVSINGEPVPLPGGVAAYPTDGDQEFDPAVVGATPLLYALREGRLASGSSAGGLEVVSGPLGAEALGVRSVGVDLRAMTAAAVTEDGSTVLAAPVGGANDAQLRTAYAGGTDLLRPAWDAAGRMWLVDRTPEGAEVRWVHAGESEAVDVPGISGRRVHSFVVSRDGTRLVAVVRTGDGPRILVTRIAHTRKGRVLWATPARRIDDLDSDLPIRSIAWRTPTTLAVLSPFSRDVAQVRVASVDGAPVTSGVTTTIEGRLRDLAGSPSTDDSLYGVTASSLVDLAGSVRRESPLPESTRAVTYAG